jgi:long-chain acyl-CoA synthetase
VIELVCMPLTHSFAFARVRCVLAARGTAVLMSGLARPDDLFAALARHRVDSIGLVPIACRMLIDHYRARLAELGPQIRHIELGSDFLHRRYKEDLLELFPRARICMHYGLTEASRSAFIELRSEREMLDTIGRPTPGVEVAVLDGEICVRGPTLMLGYWRKPELTAEAMRDGWLHTGDLGSRDGAGYLRLLGRRSEVFKVAGLGVAPQEIEAVLAAHPDVADAAVAARASHTTTAVELVAFVVARSGARPDPAELRKLCRAELESHKVPARIVVVAALPRTASGKLQRQELDRLDGPDGPDGTR